jgi:hypothetical protein
VVEGATAIAAVARLTARERALAAGGTVPIDEQLQALVDATTVLAGMGVSHALIGGIAVGVRSGVPRATMDVDLTVASAVPVQRLVDAMVAGGFTHRRTHARSASFRHASGEPVRLAFDVRFDDAIDRAEPVSVAATTVRVVTREDLIAMKTWAASDPTRRRSKALRDQADIELLRGDVPDDDEGW